MLARLAIAGAFLAASIGSVAGVWTEHPGVGELLNPSFEDCELIGGRNVPTHWTQGGTGNGTHPTVECSSEKARTGTKSARFIPQSVTQFYPNEPAGVYIAEIAQTVDLVHAGQMVTLSYWVFFGGVPEGQDPSTSGRYSFTVYWEDENHVATPVEVAATFDNNSGTAVDNYFYHFTAQFHAPYTPTHNGTLTIYFESITSAIYIYLDDVELIAPYITGDPQFVGLRGQSYQVHGMDGEFYNLVSSMNTQINAKFVFLSEGECPIFQGIPDKNCWAHAGSYLGEIGIMEVVGSTTHRLAIIAGNAKQGFAQVTLNGRVLSVGDSFQDGEFQVHLTTTHHINVQTAQFAFAFDNSDLFINQAVAARVPLSQLTSHGLFGQTHINKIYNSAIKYIAGDVDDYIINDHDLFGTDFVYNRFQQA